MSARKFSLTVAKKYGNVTVSFGDNESVNVWLHQTKIVKFQGETVKLNAGGWLTNTTKTAMNTALSQSEHFKHLRVFQKKNVWYVSNGDNVIEFQNGIEFTKLGEITASVIRENEAA